MNDRLRKLLPYPSEVLGAEKRELLARGKAVFDFGTGDPELPVPAAAQRALIDALPDGHRHPEIAGSAEARQAVAEYLRQRFGVAVDPEREVLITLGSKDALFHLPMTFVQVPSDKDLVLYGEPGYPVYEIGALFAEAWTYAVPLDEQNGWLMDPGLVPEATLRRAAVVFLNYPHNPTGQRLPAELFRAWVAARDEYGFVLVGDECYADLWSGDERPHSLLEFGTKGCLAVHSLSKRSGMAGYRSGFVAGDAELLAHYRRFRVAMGTAPQEFVQAAAAVAWRDQAHVAERRKELAAKRRMLGEFFGKRGMRVLGGDAGPYLWVEVPAGTTGEQYAERCREHGILVAKGTFFGKGQDRFVRVALHPDLADCERALQVWPR